MTDAGSILSILLLAATFGTTLSVEANGFDEEQAIQEVLSVFEDNSDTQFTPTQIADDKLAEL